MRLTDNQRPPGKYKATDPVTAERLEWCLDRLAIEMNKDPKNAHVFLPLFQRFEYELTAMREREALIERAMARCPSDTR
jgi:hypothetical protein